MARDNSGVGRGLPTQGSAATSIPRVTPTIHDELWRVVATGTESSARTQYTPGLWYVPGR